MMDHLNDGLGILSNDLGIQTITHVPCLAHVIQLGLNALIEKIKIKAKNKKVIDEWDDDNHDPSTHSSAREGDGAPWTLKKV
jgi:hypothetical protein